MKFNSDNFDNKEQKRMNDVDRWQVENCQHSVCQAWIKQTATKQGQNRKDCQDEWSWKDDCQKFCRVNLVEADILRKNGVNLSTFAVSSKQFVGTENAKNYRQKANNAHQEIGIVIYGHFIRACVEIQRHLILFKIKLVVFKKIVAQNKRLFDVFGFDLVKMI